MKQPIRFFSIGLLVSSVLLFVYYAYFEEEAKPEVITEELSIEDMIAEVEAKGHKVLTNDDYMALTLSPDDKPDSKDSDKKENDKKDKDSDKDDKNSSKKEDEEDEEDLSIITYTFETEDGVVSEDIADLLVKNKIIDDKWAFLSYLEDNDYMKYIQLGEFTVSNDMSFKDIAEIITTYPGK